MTNQFISSMKRKTEGKLPFETKNSKHTQTRNKWVFRHRPSKTQRERKILCHTSGLAGKRNRMSEDSGRMKLRKTQCLREISRNKWVG